MWELDHKEAWALKNWCFSIVMLEKTLESPLGCKRIKPVNPKGDQPWIFTGMSLKLGKIENRMSVLQKVFNFFSGCSEVKVDQSCPTLCDSMDYTIHGILQARILEWVAYPFSSRSSWPRNWTQVSHIAGRFFTSWANRKAPQVERFINKVSHSLYATK